MTANGDPGLSNHVLELIDQLSVVASGFATIDDLDALGLELRSALARVVDIQYSGLYLWDFEAQRLRLMYATGFSDAERDEAERTAWERHPGEVFRTQQMFLVDDVDADPEQRTQSSKRDFVIRSRLVMPIVFRGESLGLFLLASEQTGHFSAEHIAVLRFMSRLTGVVYRQLLDREARRRAQLALEDAARRIRLVVGSLPIALFVVDAAGKIALAEGTVVAALTREAPTGRPLSECFADAPQLRALFERARRRERLPSRQVVRDQILEVHAAANADGGVTVMLHDVTARQHNVEELARLNGELLRALSATRSKSQFLAAMSHELRTPVNAILGYAELLREDSDAGDPPDPEDIRRIQTTAQLLLRLINDNLDISKIEAGKMTLEIEDVELAPLLAAIEVAMEPLRARNDNRARVVLAPGLGTMRTDGTALRRILINLLGNAHKFTHGGEVTLEVRAEERPDGSVVVFEVADTGIGMRPDQLARIFEPYTQADPSTTRRFGGTGLGLTLSKQLVNLLGGDISVTSTEGAGSRFVVTLPAASE
jgi:signal transduction histidine kinase